MLRTMALFSDLISRQLSLSGSRTGSLKTVLRSFQCRSEDEVFLEGGLTGGDVPAFACKFSKNALNGNLLAIADEEGSVRLMDTRKPASKSFMKEIGAHRNAIFDIAWLPGDSQLLTASGDTKVGLWDVVGGVLLSTFGAHMSSVKTVDVKTNDPSVFVSGSRDGSICVWDTRCVRKGSQHRPVNTISMAHKKSGLSNSNNNKKKKGRGQGGGVTPTPDLKQSVTSVCFHGDNKIASVGTADGVVKIWDMRRNFSSCKREPPPAWHTFAPIGEAGRQYGFTSLVSDPSTSLLFASSTDNIIYTYSSTTLSKTPVGGFSGHKNSSFYVKAAVSSDGRYLLSGSSCGNAFIWEIDNCEAPPLMLVGHMTEVTAVDWCPTQIDKVVTCSDGNDVRFWRVSQQSKGNSLPGAYIGDCEEYKGQGHLKAKQALKIYQEQFNKEQAKTRRPLTLAASNSRQNIVSTKDEQSPRILRFVSHSSTPSLGHSSSKSSTLASVRERNNDGTIKVKDLTCIVEQRESESDSVSTSCKHQTELIESEVNKERISLTVDLSHQNETKSLSNSHSHSCPSNTTTCTTAQLNKPPSSTQVADESAIVVKAEITPERSCTLPCGSRKRKLLFEPSIALSESSSSTPATRQEASGGCNENGGSSKRRRTGQTGKRRSRLKEKVAPSPGSLRHCQRKGVQNKTPQREPNQTSVQLYFKPNTN